MIYAILGTVVLCYGVIQFLELGALLGRIAGLQSDSVVMGYSIQQTVYMVTRFFVIALLPLLGFVIDMGIPSRDFIVTAHLSLIFATVFGGMSVLLVRPIVGYYSGVIERYNSGKNFVLAFWGRPVDVGDFFCPGFRELFSEKDVVKTLFQANFVFLIYSTGLFVSFYFALVYHDYRASISQMSGVVNALGAVILTLVVEPKISRYIDRRDKNAVLHVFALFWGRLLATAVTGQLVLLILFSVS